MRDVAVAGVGLTDFGKHLDRSLGSLAEEALAAALADAGLESTDIDATYFSNAAAGLLSGQEMIRGEVALKGIDLAGGPIINVENACASGGSAAQLAWLAVASGAADTALALGAEKLFHDDKQLSFAAIESGTDLSLAIGPESGEPVSGSVMMSAYAAEARAYAERNGEVEEALAAIAVKNRAQAALNPHAQYQKSITAADVEESRLVADPLRLLTCSPLTDGSAAVIFRAADGAERDVDVRTSIVRSNDRRSSVVARGVDAAYAAVGWSAADVDVFALHDACAFAELQQYEQIGIAAEGGAIAAATGGVTALGGTHPVNTDGGLMSRGHALGATGLAQLSELVIQLRGEAGERQVRDAKAALAVNAGGWMGEDYAAVVVTALQKN
jgi:acetyl-CoA acetyltransferase